MIELDGSYGEGGGQLVRTAVAVAAVRAIPLRIRGVRARRRNPGLAAQHVAAVRAVASICDAACEGVELHSTTIGFSPRRLHGGKFRVDVGTAGSISLVLQAMLPVLVATGERCHVTLHGGTDVRAAPPIDYFRLVLLPLLAEMGVRAELAILRRGYFPHGGGEVHLDLAPVPRLRAFAIEDAGALECIDILAHVTRLDRVIAQRMCEAAVQALSPGAPIAARVEQYGQDLASGPGGAIVLRARMARTRLGSARVAQRGVPAERLGAEAGRALARDLRAGATLDVHAADQMLVFLALADERSVFRTSAVTSHATTAMWLLERLASTRFTVDVSPSGACIEVVPAAG